MVKVMGRRPSIKQTGVMSKSGVVVPTTAAGTSLGGGTVSAGNTSTAANVQSTTIVKPGPSVNQLSSSSGIHLVAPVSSVSSSGTQNTNTEYKLSIASMLLAMKNQALGALSLGGSKAGGSITENYSGVNLG